jgi:Holliday junction DNA helicase RuvA
MIGKLIGKIDSIFDDKLILNVSGVGYNVACSAKTLGRLNKDQEVSLTIETIVREDHIHLYGFQSEIERGWFKELCKVKGVGNKVALKILSILEINDIIAAISSADKAYFSTVPGVGPKLALRIISELKDSVTKVAGKISGCDIDVGTMGAKTNDVNLDNSQLLADGVSALENLGYKRMEIYKVVSNAISEKPDSTLESLITSSLRKLNK